MKYDPIYIKLFKTVKNHSPYSDWKSYGEYELRPNEKNPSVSLTPVGTYDFKTEQPQQSLVEIAVDLGLTQALKEIGFTKTGKKKGRRKKPKPFPEKNAVEAFKDEPEILEAKAEELALETKRLGEVHAMYNQAKDGTITLKLYLEGRGIKVTEKLLESLKALKVRERFVNEGVELLIPITNAAKDITQLNRILLDSSSLKKITKKQFGKHQENTGTFFGKAGTNIIYIVEGFEDAATLLAGPFNDSLFLVSNGAGNLSKMSGLIGQLRSSLSKINGSLPKVYCICDNDKNKVGVRKSEGLPDYVTRLLPEIECDANAALQRGDLNEWVKSLREIDPTELHYYEEITKLLKNPDYKKYIQFIRKVCYDLRVDIVSDEIYVKPKSNSEWIPYGQHEKSIQGLSRSKYSFTDEGKKKPEFILKAFEEHLQTWKNYEAEPQLLISIPKWDGVPRLEQIASKIQAKYFSTDEVYQILREHAARTYGKIFNPSLRQHFLVLVGGQGKGKDQIVEALYGGFTYRYLGSPAINSWEQDMVRAIHEKIVVNMPEFDQFKYHPGTLQILKKIITQPYFDFDQKWVKGNVKQANRCSFIGSSNTLDVLRDSTGNRRYRILEIEDINLKKDDLGTILEREHNYPGDLNDPNKARVRLQLIAEHKANYESGHYEVSPSLNTKIEKVIHDLTPEDPLDEIHAAWEDYVNVLVQEKLITTKSSYEANSEHDKWQWISANGIIGGEDAVKFIDDFAHKERTKPKLVRMVLAELRKRGVRGYWKLTRRGYEQDQSRRQYRCYAFNRVGKELLQQYSNLLEISPTGSGKDLLSEGDDMVAEELSEIAQQALLQALSKN